MLTHFNGRPAPDITIDAVPANAENKMPDYVRITIISDHFHAATLMDAASAKRVGEELDAAIYSLHNAMAARKDAK